MSDFEPVVVCLACDYCAYTAADLAGVMGLSYPASLKIMRVPCTGKVDVIHIMRALQRGADGVLVAGCLTGDCHFENGNRRAAKRVAYVQKLLADIGLESERVAMLQVSAGQGRAFAEGAAQFVSQIKSLGPSPIKGQAGRAAA